MEKPINRITVQKLLINLGFTPKGNGYRYLTTAILVKLESRPNDIAMFRLCDKIGDIYGVTGTSVERCMRFAISRAYKFNKFVWLNELFNAYIITESPTLSDFIMYIVEYLDSFYQYDDLILS